MRGYQYTYKNHRVFYNNITGDWYAYDTLQRKTKSYETETSLLQAICQDTIEIEKRLLVKYNCNVFNS